MRRVGNWVDLEFSDRSRVWVGRHNRGLSRLSVQTLFITPGSPWENGYIESFNARLKLFLSTEIFDTVKEAQIVVELWRVHYNTERPHSSLGYRPPAPETKVTLLPAPLPRYAGSRERTKV